MELALVLPVLALLAVGVADLGRAYRVKTRVTNAAREGAVLAQYFPTRADNSGSACADPRNVAFATRNEPGQAQPFTVSVTRASDGRPITGCELAGVVVAPGTEVVVSASTPFEVLSPIVAALVGSTVTLRADVRVVVQG